MLLFSLKRKKRMGYSNWFVVILSLIIALFVLLPVHAEEVPTCEMTIKSDVHTRNNPAYPGGVCGGTDYVWGYYVPHLDEFALRGFINYNIPANPNGQVFELPMGDEYTYAKLIVYTIKVNPPKNENPKEEKPKEQKPKEQKPEEQKPKEQKPKEQKPKENKPKIEAPSKKNSLNSVPKSSTSNKSSSSSSKTSTTKSMEQKNKSSSTVNKNADSDSSKERNKNTSNSIKKHNVSSDDKTSVNIESENKNSHDKGEQKTTKAESVEQKNKNLKNHIAKNNSEHLEDSQGSVFLLPITLSVIVILTITGGFLYWWYKQKRLKEK